MTQTTVLTFPVKYSVMVRYDATKPTAVGSTRSTLAEAVATVREDYAFIRSLGDHPWVESAEAVCAECSGAGTIIIRTRGRYFGKSKVCPACKGRNSARDIMPELLVALNTAEAR